MSILPAAPLCPFRRLLAVVCAALVLALTVFAASPAAHESLHLGHAHEDAEHGCAVVLFAAGVALPVGPVAPMPPVAVRVAPLPLAGQEIFLVSPRYLRQPERGPPESGRS